MDIGKGVGSAAAVGAISRGISAATSSVVKEHHQSRQVKAEVKKYGKLVESSTRKGADSIEVKAYARQNKKQVVVHHDDGSATTYGSKSAKESIHLHYDASKQHYSAADKSGKPNPTGSSRANYGECLFEAIAHGSGEDPAAIRRNMGKYIQENPQKLKTKVTELNQGGIDHGYGAKTQHRKRCQKAEFDKIESAIKLKKSLNPEEKFQMRGCIRKIDHYLNREIPEPTYNKILSGGDKALKGRFCVHSLRTGQVAVDVNAGGGNGRSRGLYRVIFDVRNGNKLTFNAIMDHYQPLE